jgi:hypothetical protein
MHKALVPCSILLLSGVLCAQGYVSPSHHRNAEGLSNNVFPSGTSFPSRYAQVHDDVPAMPILRMRRFRDDVIRAARLRRPGPGRALRARAGTRDER